MNDSTIGIHPELLEVFLPEAEPDQTIHIIQQTCYKTFAGSD